MKSTEAAINSGFLGQQCLNIQFYRQRLIGQYIVDFFAPRARLVVEVDGSQHMEKITFKEIRTVINI